MLHNEALARPGRDAGRGPSVQFVRSRSSGPGHDGDLSVEGRSFACRLFASSGRCPSPDRWATRLPEALVPATPRVGIKHMDPALGGQIQPGDDLDPEGDA